MITEELLIIVVDDHVQYYDWWVLTSKNVRFPAEKLDFEDILNQMPNMPDENVISEQQICQQKYVAQKRVTAKTGMNLKQLWNRKKRWSPGFTLHNWNPSMIP